jgi:hypothetical protein
MRPSVRPIAAAIISAAWLLSVSAANAQNKPPSPEISDQKLNAAAAALERVASLQQNYQQRMAAASPSEKEGVASAANSALEKAVTDQGLSVQEYKSIIEVAQNDPDVREKLLQRLRPPAK